MTRPGTEDDRIEGLPWPDEPWPGTEDDWPEELPWPDDLSRIRRAGAHP
jgi:hypothetical protein